MNRDLGVGRARPARARRDRHDDRFVPLLYPILERGDSDQRGRCVWSERDLSRRTIKRVIHVQRGGAAQCVWQC